MRAPLRNWQDCKSANQGWNAHSCTQTPRGLAKELPNGVKASSKERFGHPVLQTWNVLDFVVWGTVKDAVKEQRSWVKDAQYTTSEQKWGRSGTKLWHLSLLLQCRKRPPRTIHGCWRRSCRRKEEVINCTQFPILQACGENGLAHPMCYENSTWEIHCL